MGARAGGERRRARRGDPGPQSSGRRWPAPLAVISCSGSPAPSAWRSSPVPAGPTPPSSASTPPPSGAMLSSPGRARPGLVSDHRACRRGCSRLRDLCAPRRARRRSTRRHRDLRRTPGTPSGLFTTVGGAAARQRPPRRAGGRGGHQQREAHRELDIDLGDELLLETQTPAADDPDVFDGPTLRLRVVGVGQTPSG